MSTELPPMADVRARLLLLRDAELEDLAASSGVPASTIRKIRQGVTPNPGFETVRKFFPLLPAPAANDTNASQTAQQGVANA
jgi:hypothetical protein